MAGTIMIEEDVHEASSSKIADKIRHILQIYPKISPSMLHIAMGPTIPVKDWRPVLDHMVAEQEVSSDTISKMAPSGRVHNYTILSLVEE